MFPRNQGTGLGKLPTIPFLGNFVMRAKLIIDSIASCLPIERLLPVGTNEAHRVRKRAKVFSKA